MTTTRRTPEPGSWLGIPPFPKAAKAALAQAEQRKNLRHATGTIREKRAVRAAEVGREHRRGTALTGGRGERGLRVAGGHDERDGRADLRGRAEQSGRRRRELARRRDVEDDENRVCSEIHHDLPLTPDGSR